MASFRAPANHRHAFPLMNVHESDNNLEYSLELPGMDANDVTITEENGIVNVSGVKKLTHESNSDGYHSIETSYGSFSRSFRVPENCDANSLTATFSNGVLNLNFNKQLIEKPVRKTIKIAQ